MSAIRILAVHAEDAAEPADSLGFFAACAELVPGGGASLSALIIGAAPDERHARNAVHAGARSVCLAAHPQLASPIDTDQLLAVLQPQLEQMPADIIVLPAHSAGEETAARLAMRMEGAALGLCSSVARAERGWIACKTLFGGRIQVELATSKGPCFVVVRTAARSPCQPASEVAPRLLQLNHPLPKARFMARPRPDARRKPLEKARIIVCGGRGVDEQGFSLLQLFADRLGAALGGSLPAVDAGLVPVSHQVGQSGKYVAPAVYIAVGISGTPQHLAGIAPQSEVIAINSDPEADIFKRAKVGVVARWQTLLPLLIEHCEQNAVEAKHGKPDDV